MDRDLKHAGDLARNNQNLVTKPDTHWQERQRLENEHRRVREIRDSEARKRNGW